MLQLLHMTDLELKMVADHMGHNLNVHANVYWLQSSLLEKTKVARVLIATENGQINKFQGRRLDAISINGKYCDNSEDIQNFVPHWFPVSLFS